MHTYPSMDWSAIDVLFVDLDDTVYRDPRVADQITHNVGAYLCRQTGRSEPDAIRWGFDLYRRYGTTYAGLVANGFCIDPDDWHASIYETLPYDTLFRRDGALRDALQKIPVPKYVFTNAHRNHANAVLQRLGLESCFVNVIGFDAIQTRLGMRKQTNAGSDPPPPYRAEIACKPNRIAFALALDLAGNPDPRRCCLIDDSIKNIETAQEMGMHTVWVTERPFDRPSFLSIGNLCDLVTL